VGRFAVLLKSVLLLGSVKKVIMPGCAHSKEYRKCAPTPRNIESAQFKEIVYFDMEATLQYRTRMLSRYGMLNFRHRSLHVRNPKTMFAGLQGP
jgi:hypothetical protein